jgi:multiple sugar transport system permease protein
MKVSVHSPQSIPVPRERATLRTRGSLRWQGQLSAWLFLLPALLVFGVFAWYPILKTVIFSFQNVSLNGESTWVGLDNFQRMLNDPNFSIAWQNSFLFASLSLLMGFFVPILVAIMVNEMRRAKAFFRLVYFLPTVIPITITILIWRLMYAPDSGYLNAVFATLGVQPHAWLQDPALVKPAIIIMLTWANFGSTVLLYIAALQDIPSECYEAAEIEGANPFERISYITFPMLYPTMIITFVLQIIAVVQIFTEPFLLTQGGPGTSTLTPVLVIYRTAFLSNDYGLASAWSLSLVIILSLFSVVYLRLSRRTA